MREFFKFRALLYELTVRDIKVKYRRSILGLFWTVLNPLLMMLVLWFVFSRLFRFDIENYALYVLSGQVIFNYFQMCTTDAMMAIVNNGSLIKKVYIPKYMLVLVKILSGAVYLIASFAALVIVMAVTGEKIHFSILLSIVPFACIFLFSLGIGLLLSAVTVKFRDMLHLYGVFCTALFYMTPVIYPVSILPDYMKTIVCFNPLTAIIDVFRMMVLEGRIPSGGQVFYCIGISLIMLWVGKAVFQKRQDSFIQDL